MMRSIARSLALGGVLFCIAGCLGDGLPWGELNASVTASFAPSPGRLDAQGRLKTAGNYVVALDDVAVGFDALSVVLAAQGAAGFDPANPPEGYSLCHNGHCHSDSGALVDYEDIALEMAGGSGGMRVVVGLDTQPQILSAVASPVAPTPCEPSPCEVPLGELAGIELNISSIRLRGTVFDTLSGDARRLPEEGYAVDLDLPLTTVLTAEIQGSIGPGAPVGLNLAVDFQFPAALLDDIDFGAAPPADEDAWKQALNEALIDHAALNTTMTRSND